MNGFNEGSFLATGSIIPESGAWVPIPRCPGSPPKILGLYSEDGKEMEATIVHWGYILIMEKKTEATIVYYWVT